MFVKTFELNKDKFLRKKMSDDNEYFYRKWNKNGKYKFSSPYPLKWDHNDVTNWLYNEQINSYIIYKLYHLNGIMLFKFYEMKTQAPNFYYKVLYNKHSHTTLHDIIFFTYKLTRLFTPKNKT